MTKTKTEKIKKISKIETGIKGFDKMLEGGVPENRTMLVVGGTGSGKTVILNEFLYRGITEFDQPGVMVTFEERPRDIKRNVKSFGWDYQKLEEEGKLAFVDFSPDEVDVEEIGDYNWADTALTRIKAAAEKVGAKRIAIDNPGVIFSRYSKFKEHNIVREAIFYFLDGIKKMNLTGFMGMESGEQEKTIGRYGIEEYVADGVIALRMKPGENRIVREMIVEKIRGLGYRSGVVKFDITKEGLEVFPKIKINMEVAETDFKERKKFGIKGLDEAIKGGVPKGHVVLVGGNTGSGKSTLGMHFLMQGIEEGEKGIFVNLEESVTQVRKTAMQHGWDVKKYEDKNEFRFITSSLLDVSTDKLLSDILEAVDEMNAERVVIDSVSTLESAAMNQEDVRQFLLQLASAFKARGVTSIANYLTSEVFGSAEGQLLGDITTNEMRLSSITDGIILLRYVERKQQVDKLLNILKMRGSAHDKSIFKFTIEEDGIKMGKKFK